MGRIREVLEQIGEIPNRKYAVIVDEAHSSQTGESATKMRQALGTASSTEEELAVAAKEQEAEDKKAQEEEDETDAFVLKVMRARKRQPNAQSEGLTPFCNSVSSMAKL